MCKKLPINIKAIMPFILLFGTMFIFGAIGNIRGVSYPLIKTEFGISYEQQGAFVSIISFGYVAFCIVGGILLGSFGVKKTYLAGFVAMVLGLTGAFFLPGYLSVAAALFVIASSFGLLEINVNALAAQTFTRRSGLYLNLLHFMFGAGAILGPRMAGALAVSHGWRYAYLASIPMALLFFTMAVFTKLPDAGSAISDNTEKPKRTSYFTAIRTPTVWFLAAVLGLMLSVDISSSNWAGLYFQDIHGLDPRISGAAFLSNYFILFTISRLLSGFAIEKIGYVRSLFIASLAVIFIFVLGFLLGARGIFILPGLGFFTAIQWPTIMAVAIKHFKEDAPIMTSAIIPIAGGINSAIQYLIGLTNRYIGPAWGYRSSVFYAVLAHAALVFLSRRLLVPHKARQ